MKNKLNIEEIKLLIPDYITGYLSEEENNKVKNAIDNSLELRELYVDLKNAFEFTNSVKLDEPAPQYWNNLLPRIHQKIDERVQKQLAKNPLSYLWKILVPVAAVLLIFIIYRISYNPKQELTEKDENKFGPEKIESVDTLKKKIESPQVKENIEPEVTKNKVVLREKLNIKKENLERVEEQIAENTDNTDIFVEGNSEFASVAVEELTIFGAGAPGVFDEETDIELEKLDDSEREAFLEELKNNL